MPDAPDTSSTLTGTCAAAGVALGRDGGLWRRCARAGPFRRLLGWGPEIRGDPASDCYEQHRDPRLTTTFAAGVDVPPR